MSFINYYPVLQQPEFDYFIMLFTAAIIPLVVWIIWYVYAINYRYSSDRIENKLLKKYDKPINDNQTINASEGQVITNAASNSIASALITIRDKGIHNVLSTHELYSLPVNATCSPMDKTCITL
jgi:hypothetical protein